MVAPVTANTVSVTQQAHQLFEQNTEDLSQVRDTVGLALSELTNTGLAPVPLGQLTSALQEWDAALNDMISLSQWMADMLLATWQLIQKNEQNNTELTAGLAVQAEPGGSRIPGPDGTDNTVVAPGQTIRIWERAEPP